MAKYRKKPVVIEAFQWFTRMGNGPIVVKATNRDGVYHIETLEGWLTVSDGDWIITGVKGEHYPCKPDIFAATYDAVDAEEQG